MDPACYYRLASSHRGPRITRAEVDRPEINGETDLLRLQGRLRSTGEPDTVRQEAASADTQCAVPVSSLRTRLRAHMSGATTQRMSTARCTRHISPTTWIRTVRPLSIARVPMTASSAEIASQLIEPALSITTPNTSRRSHPGNSWRLTALWLAVFRLLLPSLVAPQVSWPP